MCEIVLSRRRQFVEQTMPSETKRERSIERTLSRRAKVENSLKRNHLEEFKTTQLHQVNPLPTPRPEWVDLINGGNQRVEEREQWNYNNRFGNASGGAEELLPTPRGVQASMMNLQK